MDSYVWTHQTEPYVHLLCAGQKGVAKNDEWLVGNGEKEPKESELLVGLDDFKHPYRYARTRMYENIYYAYIHARSDTHMHLLTFIWAQWDRTAYSVAGSALWTAEVPMRTQIILSLKTRTKVSLKTLPTGLFG